MGIFKSGNFEWFQVIYHWRVKAIREGPNLKNIYKLAKAKKKSLWFLVSAYVASDPICEASLSHHAGKFGPHVYNVSRISLLAKKKDGQKNKKACHRTNFEAN